jgi:hypothetical protein
MARERRLRKKSIDARFDVTYQPEHVRNSLI